MAQELSPADDAGIQGKGHPTPRRKDREAELKRPLVSNNRKEARARLTKERERARLGLANGEERFLPLRDKGKARKRPSKLREARSHLCFFSTPPLPLERFRSLSTPCSEEKKASQAFAPRTSKGT